MLIYLSQLNNLYYHYHNIIEPHLMQANKRKSGKYTKRQQSNEVENKVI